MDLDDIEELSDAKMPEEKDELQDDLNDRVDILQSDQDMDALINNFNKTNQLKKDSIKSEKKKIEQIAGQPQGDEDDDGNEAWGNFSDLNNTADLVGHESQGSGFSEFDAKKDGDIINAIK